MMNRSRGALYFHPIGTVQELGLGKDPEPFIKGLIRAFLKVGIHGMDAAVAARWIEMPRGVLLFQMTPGDPASGAIYLYDRKQQVFYLVGFDGAEDNLTLEEFNQLMAEYDLLRFAEHPSLAQLPPPPPPPPPPGTLPAIPDPQLSHVPRPEMSVQGEFDLTTTDCLQFTTKQGVRWYARPGLVQLHFQGAGSA